MVFLWEELGTGTLLGAMAVVKFNPLRVLTWMAVRPAWFKCWPNFLFLFLLKGSEASPGSSGYTLLLLILVNTGLSLFSLRVPTWKPPPPSHEASVPL